MPWDSVNMQVAEEKKEGGSGCILDEKYKIVRVLGSGGSGTVYLGEHILLKSCRAIKQIAKNNRFYERLMKEASVLKNLKHPNIPIIYDIEEDEKYAYIIEEYLEGESLKSYILRQEKRERETVTDFALQVCDLIGYLHRGENPILYLDLKPENLLVQQGVLKLLDFGAAVSWNEREEYGKFSWGTPGYAAPEQYEGIIKADERSDIYGFGMLLFFMMTGETYGTSGWDRIREEMGNPGIGKPFGKLLKKCLKQCPEERYQTIEEVWQELWNSREKREKQHWFLEKIPVFKKSGKKDGKPFLIAVAGSQKRIGTTHTSIMLTVQLKKMGIKSVYLEASPDRVVETLLAYTGTEKEEICQMRGCHMAANHSWQIKQIKESGKYQAFVQDFGILTENNRLEFEQADYCCLVVGIKPWEDQEWWENQEQNKRKCFLVNYADEASFRGIPEKRKIKCLRLPYQPDPFQWKNKKTTEEMEELAEEIIGNSRIRELF